MTIIYSKNNTLLLRKQINNRKRTIMKEKHEIK